MNASRSACHWVVSRVITDADSPAAAPKKPSSAGTKSPELIPCRYSSYLGRELAEPDRAWVSDVRVERIAEASHWVQADASERVNQLMVDFLLEPIGG
jgi:pimeloyl-ACP methyl ester carboxylesterase